MADYYTPTVIQPAIFETDMTPLERLVLGHVFDAETDSEGTYFFTEIGPSDCFGLPVDRLRAALARSQGSETILYDHFVRELAALSEEDAELDVDLGDIGWESIFQDIVRRSSTLDHVTAVAAFTCSRMRPDGFGGMATLITADAIKSKSTSDILEEFLAGDGATGGRHVLLELSERAVRAEIATVIETDPELTALTADEVSEADIHAACLAVAEHIDLSERRGAAEFRAALAAIREAERRRLAAAPPA